MKTNQEKSLQSSIWQCQDKSNEQSGCHEIHDKAIDDFYRSIIGPVMEEKPDVRMLKRMGGEA